VIGLICGLEKYCLSSELRAGLSGETRMNTPFGRSSIIKFLEVDGGRLPIILRHGVEEIEVTAPFVNYRANIYALKELGVNRIVSLNLVGAINPILRIGDLVVPHDFIDFTKRRVTFYENRGWGHVRMSPPLCPELRNALIKACKKHAGRVMERGVYACTEGPRLETPAEIQFLRMAGGDVVGMTLATEATLARELEICYASVCFVMNYAEGVRVDERGRTVWIPEEERGRLEELPALFTKILLDAIEEGMPMRGGDEPGEAARPDRGGLAWLDIHAKPETSLPKLVTGHFVVHPHPTQGRLLPSADGLGIWASWVESASWRRGNGAGDLPPQHNPLPPSTLLGVGLGNGGD